MGNFQHENDSTLEISSLHLRSESEKPGPHSVCVVVVGGGGWKVRLSGY